jgi:EmrB/QacA subfamily drug resistance transporter
VRRDDGTPAAAGASGEATGGATGEATGRRAAVGLRSERGPVLIALMLATALVAIDGTIIATAVPSIVRDVGGFTSFPWLFSSYLLAQAVTVPLYGRFADVVGRRPILLLGIGLFLLGSVLCGAAASMPVLIAARAVQGLGAGAVQPITITIVGDLYTLEERARVQGYLASVWGASSVVGPTLGGLFSQYLSWRWIFFVNLPVGAIAVWMLLRTFHERVTRRSHNIDHAGAAVLTLGCSALILGLLEGGVSWRWASAAGVGLPAAGVALLGVFLLVERRAAEPVLPLWVLGRKVLAGGNLVGLGVGAMLIGVTSYAPTYVQGVLGTGPLVAGLAVAALTVGWPLAATVAGRIYLRIGFRATTGLGTAIVLVGALGCTLLTAGSTLWELTVLCFVLGVGLGLCASPSIVAVQSSVGWERRGVVTATTMFFRSIGSAVGVAVFGAVANATLDHRLAAPPPGLAGRVPSTEDGAITALESHRAALPPAVLSFLREALTAATHQVFVGLAIVAALAVAATMLLPHRVTLLTFPGDPAPTDATAP